MLPDRPVEPDPAEQLEPSMHNGVFDEDGWRDAATTTFESCAACVFLLLIIATLVVSAVLSVIGVV